MGKFRIYNKEATDYFVLEGEDINQLRKEAQQEADKRGWEQPFSVPE